MMKKCRIPNPRAEFDDLNLNRPAFLSKRIPYTGHQSSPVVDSTLNNHQNPKKGITCGLDMTISLDQLALKIDPQKTLVILGSGSSVPSGALSVKQICSKIRSKITTDISEQASLQELSLIAELKNSRRFLIDILRQEYTNLRPTRGIINLPKYNWHTIYTTNYDKLVETSYAKLGKKIQTVTTNFDFSNIESDLDVILFKIHGTIENDVCDGSKSRIIVTKSDYDLTSEYREYIYERLSSQAATNDILIIGQSLADPDLSTLIDTVIDRSKRSSGIKKVYLLLYENSLDLALLYETRGITIAFGGIDEFFDSMIKNSAEKILIKTHNSDIFLNQDVLIPTTIDVSHDIHLSPNVSSVFNGKAATYSDINLGITFERDEESFVENFFQEEDKYFYVCLGVAGTGKTTLARRIVTNFLNRGIRCFEHIGDYPLDANAWIKFANDLKDSHEEALLFIDEAHRHMRPINALCDFLVGMDQSPLRIIIVSSKHQWNSRTKSNSIFENGVVRELSRLSENEVSNLINLYDRKSEVRSLVDTKFSGFSRAEKIRRLRDRCEADMFVCLKNIFASERINDIVLREYASLQPEEQDVYKYLSALESAGIRVHRQILLRITKLRADDVVKIIDNLDGIVSETTYSEADGIYVWRGRHIVVSEIIAKYKFQNDDDWFELFKTFINNINPTYKIENSNISDLCDLTYGIGRIVDNERQNHLLRQMISAAPANPIPRHRLIRNLIKSTDYEDAAVEIRLFESTLKVDSPIMRYKALLGYEKAKETPGLMDEDRIYYLNSALGLINSAIKKYPNERRHYELYCDISLELFKRSGDWEHIENSLNRFQAASEKNKDPDFKASYGRAYRRAEDLRLI